MVLKHFSSLRVEIEMFMSEKGKVVPELNDEKRHWELASLCDISHHLNDLNTKYQGQQEFISDMFGAVRTFEMKLKIFQKQLKNVNLCHFISCDLLHKTGSVSVPFQVSLSQKLLIPWLGILKQDSVTFIITISVHIYENPFSTEVCDV
jgi:hypothetical protein